MFFFRRQATSPNTTTINSQKTTESSQHRCCCTCCDHTHTTATISKPENEPPKMQPSSQPKPKTPKKPKKPWFYETNVEIQSNEEILDGMLTEMVEVMVMFADLFTPQQMDELQNPAKRTQLMSKYEHFLEVIQQRGRVLLKQAKKASTVSEYCALMDQYEETVLSKIPTRYDLFTEFVLGVVFNVNKQNCDLKYGILVTFTLNKHICMFEIMWELDDERKYLSDPEDEDDGNGNGNGNDNPQ